VIFGFGGGMSLSTNGLMPGSVRTSGSLAGFAAGFVAERTAASARSVGLPMEA
jgi:hypothetical protein